MTSFLDFSNSDDPKFRIAHYIVSFRYESGISQKKLAEEMGTPQSEMSRIEGGHGNITLDTLIKLADFFNKKVKIDFSD